MEPISPLLDIQPRPGVRSAPMVVTSAEASWLICTDGCLMLRGIGVVMPQLTVPRTWCALASGHTIGYFTTRREAIRALERFPVVTRGGNT
jgi:hypothetical protein